MPNDTTPAPIGADALREALWICVEHNALHFGETHNTVVQGRAALASAAQPERVPLTDVQINKYLPLGVAGYSTLVGVDEIRAFVRAIEQFHGIKPAKEQA